jgi:hypothetical protein
MQIFVNTNSTLHHHIGAVAGATLIENDIVPPEGPFPDLAARHHFLR